MTKISLKQEKQIIQKYNNGRGCVIIAREYGICHTSVLNILDKHKIPRNKNKFARKTSDKNKKKIVKAYKSGLTLEKIGLLFGMDPANVAIILENRNIKRRPSNYSRQIHFDKEFFNIKSDKLAYFYGFVLGDGSFCLKGKPPNNVPNIAISVHSNDIGVLNMFCDWISMDNSHIFHFKKTKMTRLNIRDKCVGKNKDYWGVVSNKTYFPIIPQIKNRRLLRYFLIGWIDADGSAHFKYGKGAKISLVGNDKLMKWFISSIRKLGYNGSIKVYPKQNRDFSNVCISNKKDVLQLAAILRVNDCSFCFDRKWKDIKSKLVGCK